MKFKTDIDLLDRETDSICDGADKITDAINQLDVMYGRVDTSVFDLDDMEEIDENPEEVFEDTFGKEDEYATEEQRRAIEEQEDFTELFNSGKLIDANGMVNQRVVIKDTIQYLTASSNDDPTKKQTNDAMIAFLRDFKELTSVDGKNFEEEKPQEERLEETKFKEKRRETVRTYTNQAQFYKAKYGKAVEIQKNPKKTLAIIGALCVVAGVAFGERASSYYDYIVQAHPETPPPTAMNCLTGGFMQSPPFNLLSGTHCPNVFMTNFFIGAIIMGIICMFIYMSNEEKERSRVGHEHGNARLGNNSDFKKFQNQFMD